jgi:outer membrane receptor protein involved in Fe transport
MKTALLVSCALAAIASPAFAQSTNTTSDKPAQTADSRDAGEGPDITVTGSRIVRDGYTAPTPVTVATIDELVKATPSSIPDGLNKLPQFTNSQSPSRSALNFANSPIHGNVLNLRAIGPTRTLILFDGLRVTPTTYLGTFDTNVLPNLLIQRVDIVTGGASAAYGSDAISGVVNFVLNRSFTGVSGVAQAGVSQRGDNGNQRLGLAYGTEFAEGRGHILLSGEYYNNEGMVRSDRKIGRQGYAYVGATVGCTPAGTPACLPGGENNPYTAVTNAFITAGTPFGRIIGSSVTGNPFVNTVFTGPNTFRPANPGTATGTGGVVTNGDGFQIPSSASAVAPLKTYQAFGRASYDLTDDISVFAQGIYSRSDVRFTSLTNAFSPPSTAFIYKGNPYLPAAIDASLPVGGSVTLSTYDAGQPLPRTREITDYWQATAGIEGKIGTSLKWDVSFTHGDSKLETAQSGLYDIKKAFAAVDAVVAPAGNPGGVAAGTITCNVLLNSDPAIRAQYAGCSPLNIIGVNPATATPAGYAYATGTSRYNARLKQDSVIANLSGSLFDLPAGPVDFAIGGEYRHQSLHLTSNADPSLLVSPPLATPAQTAAATAAIRAAYFAGLRGVPASQFFYYLTNVGVADGSLNVKEGYVELAVPILKDTPFFQELSINGAGRITDYSTSGSVKTWKVGTTWKPVDDLLLRGTLSRDIRAPNLFELFAGRTTALTQVIDPAQGGAAVTALLFNGGNPDLKPEVARTLTAGGVFSPSFLPGFSLAIDYFQIRVKKQIGTLTAQQIVNNCGADANAPECALITRGSDNSLTSVLVAPANTAFLRTRGIDFDASYRKSWGDTALAVRLYATRLLKYETRAFANTATLDLTGLSTVSGNPMGYPKWRGNLSFDFSYKNFGININEQYLSSLTVAIPSVRTVAGGGFTQFNNVFTDPKVGSVFYTDLTLRVDVPSFGGNFQFFTTVNNLFDRKPPIIPSTVVANNLPTNLSLYDTIGRTFTAGARIKF